MGLVLGIYQMSDKKLGALFWGSRVEGYSASYDSWWAQGGEWDEGRGYRQPTAAFRICMPGPMRLTSSREAVFIVQGRREPQKL